MFWPYDLLSWAEAMLVTWLTFGIWFAALLMDVFTDIRKRNNDELARINDENERRIASGG